MSAQARTISPEAQSGLKGSLDTFGLLEEIIYNKRTSHIVSGHQRWKILQASGRKTAQVKVIDVNKRTEDLLFYTLNNEQICGKFTPEAAVKLEPLKVEVSELFESIGLTLLESTLPVAADFEPLEEESQGRLDKKEMITCPNCGHEFSP